MSTVEATQGKHVYFVGHSFHMFIVRPLITLAKEAGIKGHWAEGWDMIGGSTPMQHWERGGDENEVKKALRTGKVEVLTLASNVVIPEPAIDLFADLAVEHNPNVLVFVQHSWGDALTGSIMNPRHRGAAPVERAEPLRNEDRDLVGAEELARSRVSGQSSTGRLRDQLMAINERHGREMASLVPVNDVVVRLREKAVAGELPGVKLQSELFRDVLGHASQPTMDAVSYAWFAALYGRNPAGMTSLRDPEDTNAPAQHAVLQQTAWDAVLEEPLSGVVA